MQNAQERACANTPGMARATDAELRRHARARAGRHRDDVLQGGGAGHRDLLIVRMAAAVAALSRSWRGRRRCGRIRCSCRRNGPRRRPCRHGGIADRGGWSAPRRRCRAVAGAPRAARRRRCRRRAGSRAARTRVAWRECRRSHPPAYRHRRPPRRREPRPTSSRSRSRIDGTSSTMKTGVGGCMLMPRIVGSEHARAIGCA